MTNWLPSLSAMHDSGVLPSFFAPLDRPIPHVAVEDIAATVVRELQRDDSRIIELAAAADYAPRDVAAAFAEALSRPVTASVVEHGQWHQAHARMGLPAAAIGLWAEMWDAFNTGHIRFEHTPERGRTTIEDFAKATVAPTQPEQ